VVPEWFRNLNFLVCLIPLIKKGVSIYCIIYKTRFARPTSRDPYPKLTLRVNGTKINHKSISAYPIKTFYMHLLVAKGFIKNKNNLPVVDHKNSVTCDYRIDNLRWCTYSQNNSGKRPRIGPDNMYDIQQYRKSV
jgi:hypothetical protein